MITVNDLEGYSRELAQKNMTLYGKAYGHLLDNGDLESYANPHITFNEFRFGTEEEIEEDPQYYEDGLFEFDGASDDITIPFIIKYHGEDIYTLEERASKIALKNYTDQGCSLADYTYDEED